MITDWLNIFFKAFWCGVGAVGFGILFNVPPKTLLSIWTGGTIAGLIKYAVLFLSSGTPVIQSSFLAALAAGILSVSVAHFRYETPMIFAIPSVIPLIPGVFAYRTMLGLIKLNGNIETDYSRTLSETVHNGVATLFIIMAIAIGVAIPAHVMRKESVKKRKIN